MDTDEPTTGQAGNPDRLRSDPALAPGVTFETGRLPLLRSVRGKLILTITLFIVVTASILSVADYRYVRNLLRTSTEQQLMLRAEGLREVILAYVGQQQERVALVASRTRLRELTRAFVDAEVAPEAYQMGTRRILLDAQAATEGFESIRVATPDGEVITATDEAMIGGSLLADPVFAPGLESATLGVPVMRGGGFVASLAAPARTNDGRLLGVLLVAVDVEPMHEMLSHIPTTFESATLRIGAREGDRIRYLFGSGRGTNDVTMRRALAGESGFAAVERDGTEVLAAFRDVGYGGWGLVAEVDADEAYEPILELRAVLVGIAILVGAVGAAVGARIAANLTRPILRLADVAGQIGNGDLAVRARVGGDDEVGIMARSFNMMTSQLERHQERLKELVQARTAQLEQRTQQLEQANEQLAELCELLETQAGTMEQDLRRAEVIQRSMLPQVPPELDGFSVRTLYRPGLNVGGDLYAVAAVQDRYLVLVVADASGHGISAALLAVLFRYRLAVVDEATGLPYAPAHALTDLNTLLSGDIRAPGVFFTCVYCVLDMQERSLVMAAAGHPPLLNVRSDGQCELLEHTGPALGLDASATYSERTMQLEPGDRLLLYTDGILDTPGDHTPDAMEIGAALAGIQSGAHELEELLALVTGGIDREDRDDVTLLTLEVAPGENHFDVSDAAAGAPAPDPSGDAQLLWADAQGQRWFQMRGRMTWTFGETLLASAGEAIGKGLGVRFDLAECEYLDSTMFGTLHEVVERAMESGAQVSVQRVPASIVAAIKELSMEVVLDAIPPDSVELPKGLSDLLIRPTDLRHQRERLLRAHEVLLHLSEANREEFGGVVDALRAEQAAEESKDQS